MNAPVIALFALLVGGSIHPMYATSAGVRVTNIDTQAKTDISATDRPQHLPTPEPWHCTLSPKGVEERTVDVSVICEVAKQKVFLSASCHRVQSDGEIHTIVIGNDKPKAIIQLGCFTFNVRES